MLTAPKAAATAGVAIMEILPLVLDLALFVLGLLAALAILKIPAMLERQISLTNQVHTTLRELLIDLRKSS